MKVTNNGKEGVMIPGLPEPVLLSGRGTGIGMDDVVFYVMNGRQYTHKYVKPKNPRTERQMRYRRAFGEVVKRWKDLPQEKKDEYNLRAENLSMTGFNLFVSETAKNRQGLGRY